MPVEYTQNNGCVLLLQSGVKHLLEYEEFIFQPKLSEWVRQGEFIIFSDEFHYLELSSIEINQDCIDYSTLILDGLDAPAIIIHEKYIHELEIEQEVQDLPIFKPKNNLNLIFSDTHLNSIETLIEYFKSGFHDKINVCLRLFRCKNITSENFELFTNVVFEYLNITKLEVRNLRAELAAYELYK